MTALTDLQAQVATTVSVQADAVSTIQTLVSELAAAIAAQANTAVLTALTSQLATSTSSLKAAIPVANT